MFGTERTLIDFRKATTGVAIISNEIGVAGDKVLAECIWNNRPGTPYRTAYITIPDSGRGTADTSNIYKWQNDDWRVLYGCGHAINATGSLCLMNGGFIGSACAPTKNVAPNGPETSQKDHKGFFITPFRRYTDAPVSYLGNDTSRGISINWCPPQWRGGNWSANSFGAWKFGNDSSYVIGNQNGTDANAQYAMWVINWKTSTWTQLTPGGAGVKTTHYNTPAVFFTAGVSSSVPREHAKAGTAAAIDMRDQGGRLNIVVNTSSPCKITGTVCNLYGRLLTRLDFDGGTRASWNHVQGAT